MDLSPDCPFFVKWENGNIRMEKPIRHLKPVKWQPTSCAPDTKDYEGDTCSRMYSLIAHHENLCTNPNWQPFHRICTLRIYVAESACFRNVKGMKGLKRYHKHMQQAIWILSRLGHWDLMRVWPLSLHRYVSVLLSGSLSSITAQPSILHPHAQQTQPSLCWECSHGSFSLW